MDDKEIARRFAKMGGLSRGRNLTKEQKVSSARYAAILRWYPSLQVYESLSKDPQAKKKYLALTRELRLKNKLPR